MLEFIRKPAFIHILPVGLDTGSVSRSSSCGQKPDGPGIVHAGDIDSKKQGLIYSTYTNSILLLFVTFLVLMFSFDLATKGLTCKLTIL